MPSRAVAFIRKPLRGRLLFDWPVNKLLGTAHASPSGP